MRKKVLITGASRGIGKSIKDAYEKSGCEVICPTRQEMDLSSGKSIITYLEKLNTPIDILINNAGVNFINNFNNLEFKELEETFQINTLSPYIISKYFIENFFIPQKSGSIINIGSLWIIKTREGRASYSMSKAALEAMTKSIAIEFGSMNIICNMISPGFIGTDLTYKNNSDTEINSIIEKVPLKRLGQSEEIADLALFLGLNNKYITGQNIYIDGGISKNF